MSPRATGINADSCVKVLAFIRARVLASGCGEYPCNMSEASQDSGVALRTLELAVSKLRAAGLITKESLGPHGTLFRLGSVQGVACGAGFGETDSPEVRSVEPESRNDATPQFHGGLEADVPLKETQTSTAAAAAVPEGDNLRSLVAGMKDRLTPESLDRFRERQLQEGEASHVLATSHTPRSLEGEATGRLAEALDRLTAALAPLASLPATVVSLVEALKAPSPRSPPPAAAAADFNRRGNGTGSRADANAGCPIPSSDYEAGLASFSFTPEEVTRAVNERIRQMKAENTPIPAPAGLRRKIRREMTTEECREILRDEEEWLAAEKKRTEEEAAFAASPAGIWQALPPEEKRRRAYALADAREAEGIARAKILNARDAIWAAKTPAEKEAAIVACISSGSQRGTPAMRRFRAAQVALEVIEAQVIAEQAREAVKA